MQNRLEPNPSMVIHTINSSVIACINTMELLHNEHPNDISSWLLPYHILASTALELCGKIKVAKRHFKDDGSIPDLSKKLSDLGHELHKLFSPKVLGAEFMQASNIVKVEKKYDAKHLIHRYDFFIRNQEQPIQVYNPESIKYWILSKNRSNTSVAAYQTTQLLELCRNVQEAAYDAALD